MSQELVLDGVGNPAGSASRRWDGGARRGASQGGKHEKDRKRSRRHRRIIAQPRAGRIEYSRGRRVTKGGTGDGKEGFAGWYGDEGAPPESTADESAMWPTSRGPLARHQQQGDPGVPM
jgi:hypothetical protein